MSQETLIALIYGVIAFFGVFLFSCMNEKDRFTFSLRTICFGLICGGLISIPVFLGTMLMAIFVTFLMQGHV